MTNQKERIADLYNELLIDTMKLEKVQIITKAYELSKIEQFFFLVEGMDEEDLAVLEVVENPIDEFINFISGCEDDRVDELAYTLFVEEFLELL